MSAVDGQIRRSGPEGIIRVHLDWGTLFQIEWSFAFFLAMLNISFIDLILSGDNAVLIAMAVHGLPPEQRRKGILFGTGAAVLLRIVLAFFVVLLLGVPLVKLAGGALILWVATKLFMESEPVAQREATTLMQAVKMILIADVTMSLDNVLAVAGASGGHVFLLLFGLALSIPIVVFTSSLFSALMDRYPVIIILGAAILGRVGGEMMITDVFIEKWLAPGKCVDYAVQAVCMIGVVVAGKLWVKWKVPRTNGTR